MMIEQPAASDAAILRTGLRDREVPRREAGDRADRLHDHHVAHAVGTGRDDAAVGALALTGVPVDDVGAAPPSWIRRILPCSWVSTCAISSARSRINRRPAQDHAALEGGNPAPLLEALVGGGQRLVQIAPATRPSSPSGWPVAGSTTTCVLPAAVLDPAAVDVVLEGCVHVACPHKVSEGDSCRNRSIGPRTQEEFEVCRSQRMADARRSQSGAGRRALYTMVYNAQARAPRPVLGMLGRRLARPNWASLTVGCHQPFAAAS